MNNPQRRKETQMKTNLKLTMTAITAAGLFAASTAFATDWAAYGTKGTQVQTMAQDAKVAQGGLDGKRLNSKATTAEIAKGTNPSVNRGETCSKKDVMTQCEFHCGS